MTKFNKLALALGLFAVMSLPLAGCTNTWHGVKSDWHHVTGDDEASDRMERAEAAPAPAAEPVVVTPNNAPRYN